MTMEHDHLWAKPYRIFLFDSLEHYAATIAELTAHLTLDPSDWIAYSNRGLAYSEIGQGAEALRDFAQAIACRPDEPVPYLNRGDLYLRAKDGPLLPEAIADFTRAAALDPQNATIHRRRAYACVQANRLLDAIESFSAALRLEPDFRQTYLDRGKTYQALGQDEAARQDFDRASKLPPYPTRQRAGG